MRDALLRASPTKIDCTLIEITLLRGASLAENLQNIGITENSPFEVGALEAGNTNLGYGFDQKVELLLEEGGDAKITG